MENCALSHPNRVALETSSTSLTFQQLHDLVIERVSYLGSLAGEEGEPAWLPIFVDYTAESVVNVLACLVGQIPFAPLDPEFPAVRIQKLLALLGNPRRAVVGPEASPELREDLLIHSPRFGEPGGGAAHRTFEPGEIQLVVTTSGSTGEPKGVLLSFATIAERIALVSERLDLEGENPRSSLMSPLHFVGGVVGLFSLLLGEGLLFVDPRSEAPQRLLERLAEGDITTLSITPKLARVLSLVPQSNPARFSRLRQVVTGAEAVRYEFFSGLKSRVPSGTELVQLFGSSEASASFMSRVPMADMPSSGLMPVGHPVYPDLVRLESIDGDDGGLFELWRAGPILSGYLGSAELNEAAFLTDEEGQRWWKSGDLFRKTEAGEWEFSGRRDDMVKIHGKFASPSEIVGALAESEEVQSSIVLPETEGGRTRFVAHVELRREATIGAAGLRQFLADRLPAHLVPSQIFLHEKLPINVRGKTDRPSLREATLKPR